jgi:hypothetical protein
MVRGLTIVAAFLFVLVPSIAFAQLNNNCVSYQCYYPPDGCFYCGTSFTNGFSACKEFWDDCYTTGFCDTGNGGCQSQDDCSEVKYKQYWASKPQRSPLGEEWQLVRVAVTTKSAAIRRKS